MNPQKKDIPKPEEHNEKDNLNKDEPQPDRPVVMEIDVPSGSSKGSTRKRTINTLTSVLAARRKKACGLKETVDDIDASDVDDQLAVVEYIEDIYKNYKSSEDLKRPQNDYMKSQPDLNSKMRSVVVDWLIEVHHKFKLTQEVLYLTINLIDRYLSMEIVLRTELQLVGISAMLIACKYEEIWAPKVNEFICISDYSRERILGMEKAILNKLEWYITVPTPYMFIVRFLKACQSDKEMENMVFFFAELSLLHYSTSVDFLPSMLAAAAVYAARCTLNKTPFWTSTLKHHTGYSMAQLHDCAALLVTLHSSLAESKLKVVRNKYSSSTMNAVALQPPAKNFFIEIQ